jgi:hypothetical protein
MEEIKKYFIRTTGKGELKIYHLINIKDFSQLDIFFNSIKEVEIYVKEHFIELVEYNEI